MNTIKINRTKELAPLYPIASKVVWGCIDPELIKQLSSKQLALVINSMNRAWDISCDYIEQEIVNEGCVYSKKYGQVLDIALPKKTASY